MPSIFGVRARFNVDSSHILLSLCCPLSPWYGMWLVLEEQESVCAVRQDFLSAHWPSLPCQGQGLLPRSTSKLQCEVGRMGRFLLVTKPLSTPLQEVSAQKYALCCHLSPSVCTHKIHCCWHCAQPWACWQSAQVLQRNGTHKLLL